MQINKINNISFKSIDRKSAQKALKDELDVLSTRRLIAEQSINQYYDLSERNGKWYVNRTNVNPDLNCAFYYKREFNYFHTAANQAAKCKKILELTVPKTCLKNFNSLDNNTFVDFFTSLDDDAKKAAMTALNMVSGNTRKTKLIRKAVMEQAFNQYYKVIEENGKYSVVRTDKKPDLDYPYSRRKYIDAYEEAVKEAKQLENLLVTYVIPSKEEHMLKYASQDDFLNKFTVSV